MVMCSASNRWRMGRWPWRMKKAQGDSHPQSFVIKLWFVAEEGEEGNENHIPPQAEISRTATRAGDQATAYMWRGYITHVASRERHYVQSLFDISNFIVPYLMNAGARVGLGWRIWHWLYHRMGKDKDKSRPLQR